MFCFYMFASFAAFAALGVLAGTKEEHLPRTHVPRAPLTQETLAHERAAIRAERRAERQAERQAERAMRRANRTRENRVHMTAVNVSLYKESAHAHNVEYSNISSSEDVRWANSLDESLDELDRSMREQEVGANPIQPTPKLAVRKAQEADPTFMKREAVKEGTALDMVDEARLHDLAEGFIDEGAGDLTFSQYLVIKFGMHNLEAFAIGMALLFIMAIGINTCWADVERLSLRKPSLK